MINKDHLQPFERHVYEALAELRTDMKSLVGNGQPGRVGKLESRMLKITIAVVILLLAVFGPSVISAIFGL